MDTEAFSPTEVVPSDGATGISPSEAARALSEYRWRRDGQTPAPEPVADSSSERSLLDPEPMRVQYPIPREEPGPELAINDAADEVAKRRETALVDAEISYLEVDTGKVKPAHETVTAEQASADLSRYRQGIDEALQATADAELQQAIDALRAGTPEQQQPVEQQQARPEPQQTEQPQAGDDEVARALQNPKVLAAVQDHVNQATAQAQYVRAAYEQALQSAYQTEVASGLASFPEFNGMSVQQAQGALHLMRQQNPQRFLEVQGHIQRLGTIQQQWTQAQQVRQAEAAQQWQQQWSQFSNASDAAYENWVTKEVPVAERQAIEAEARQMMSELYGANADQLAHVWNTNSTIRSFEGQQIMFEAARNRLAKKGIRAKRDRSAPVVQHPGAGSIERPSAQSLAVMDASRQLDKTHSAKDAAKLLTAMRAARR